MEKAVPLKEVSRRERTDEPMRRESAIVRASNSNRQTRSRRYRSYDGGNALLRSARGSDCRSCRIAACSAGSVSTLRVTGYVEAHRGWKFRVSGTDT